MINVSSFQESAWLWLIWQMTTTTCACWSNCYLTKRVESTSFLLYVLVFHPLNSPGALCHRHANSCFLLVLAQAWGVAPAPAPELVYDLQAAGWTPYLQAHSRRVQGWLFHQQNFLVLHLSSLMSGSASHTQLSELIPYLPLMRPSLLRARLPNSGSSQKDMATLDQEVNGMWPLSWVCLLNLVRQCCDWIFNLDFQAYYLCYSLLTLANEASNFQPIFPANQKVWAILPSYRNCWLFMTQSHHDVAFLSAPQKEVQLLCSELDTHIKCDIRESGKCLYRSKVSTAATALPVCTRSRFQSDTDKKLCSLDKFTALGFYLQVILSRSQVLNL